MTDFLRDLLKIHPELQEEYSSRQYFLSKEIIHLIMHNKLNLNDVIKIVDMDKDTYLRIESGDCSIEIKAYETAIEKINNFLNKRGV